MEFIITETAKQQLEKKFREKKLRIYPKIRT